MDYIRAAALYDRNTNNAGGNVIYAFLSNRNTNYLKHKHGAKIAAKMQEFVRSSDWIYEEDYNLEFINAAFDEWILGVSTDYRSGRSSCQRCRNNGFSGGACQCGSDGQRFAGRGIDCSREPAANTPMEYWQQAPRRTGLYINRDDRNRMDEYGAMMYKDPYAAAASSMFIEDYNKPALSAAEEFGGPNVMFGGDDFNAIDDGTGHTTAEGFGGIPFHEQKLMQAANFMTKYDAAAYPHIESSATFGNPGFQYGGFGPGGNSETSAESEYIDRWFERNARRGNARNPKPQHSDMTWE